MPINKLSNNRILPPNAHSVDVAKSTLDRLITTQNRKYDAAFKVNGYTGILYSAKHSGMRCACKRSPEEGGLNSSGRASAGAISELLTAHGFGVSPYATRQSDSPAYVELNTEPTFFGVASAYNVSPQPNHDTGSRKIDIEKGIPTYIHGSPFDRTGHNPEDPTVTTLVDKSSHIGAASSGVSGYTEIANDVEEDREHADIVFGGSRSADISCPICFGTGIVGGWNVLNAWRKVLVPFDPLAEHDGQVFFNTGSGVLATINSYIQWKLILPREGVSVDALRVFSSSEILRPSAILVDGVRILQEHSLLRFCDGRQHIIRLEFSSEVTVSHVELQINQSKSTVNFEFPKITSNSTPDLVDTSQPVQIVFSPLVPKVSVGDIAVESVSGRAYIVTEITDWKTNRAASLGWEGSARVAQPYEIVNLLPRRKPVKIMNTPALVRNNFGGR